MKKYNYRNCQSLFGYSAEVHIRCNGRCQLCGCGGPPLDFDLWRQMTVEHLIGKSQGGYLNEIRLLVDAKFSDYTDVEKEKLARKIDAANTVTACQFCNSTTSRDSNDVSMHDLFAASKPDSKAILKSVEMVCKEILKRKQQSVRWKLESVREAFQEHVVINTENSS